MSELSRLVMASTERGECRCGQCADRGDRPDPEGHTVDIGFFTVALRVDPAHRDEMVAEFRRLSGEHRSPFDGSALDVFDGKEHSYIEIGYWIGDQGVALQYMALGALLGIFHVLTPTSVLGLKKDNLLAQALMGQGFVQVRAATPHPTPA